MAFLQLKKASLAFGDRDILVDADLTLSAERRVALAGTNGSGKTTLLRLLAGVVPPDSGQLLRSPSLRVAYLPQSGIVAGQGSVYEDAERAFDRQRVLELEAQLLTEQAAEAPPEQALLLLTKSHELQELLEADGWYRKRELVEQTLRGLGFSSEELERPVATLSGGWQMRVALARCL
ncbi:MAG: ABC-F family ATP-binding cassette domain-containing protein, partial [Spirochaetales bacterium]|nr:ABC-F family ATP-binding cassette domain-containing protein [Spirochaetales bacterium]